MIFKVEDKNYYSKEIAEIERYCFSTPWTDEQIKNSGDNTLFFLAKADNKAVGYGGMYTVLDEGYVTNIGVMPQFRGKGLGKRLTNCLIEYSIQSGLSFLTLEVRPTNVVAIGLYKSLGFSVQGVRKKFYSNPTEDGLIMTRYFK